MLEIQIKIEDNGQGAKVGIAALGDRKVTVNEQQCFNRIKDELEIMLQKINGRQIVTGDIKVGIEFRRLIDGKTLISIFKDGKADEQLERLSHHFENLLDMRMKEVAKRPGFVTGKSISDDATKNYHARKSDGGNAGTVPGNNNQPT